MLIKRVLFFIVTLLITNCSAKQYYKFNETYYAMGTTLTITFFSYDKQKSKKILENIFKLANELESKMSCKKDNSIISLLNRKKKLKIDDPVILNTIKESLDYACLTNGAFDPSLYHLTNLWQIEKNIDINSPVIPSKNQIINILKKTGYKNLIVKDKTVILHNDISLDLGAIAKGKIIELLANYLNGEGIMDYLINGGGDIKIKGKYQGIRKWKIAITNPYSKEKFLGVINLDDISIVTSGNYERYFITNDGSRYHHVFDQQTGYPSETGVDSVTVLTNSSSRADVMATALFVMGEKEGLDFANQQENLEAIYVSKKNNKINIAFSKGVIGTKNSDETWNFILNTTKNDNKNQS